MRLWFLEFKKLFLRTGMLILVFAVLVVNAGKISVNGYMDPKVLGSKGYWNDPEVLKAEKQLSGKITEENMRFLSKCKKDNDSFLIGSAEYSESDAVYSQLYAHYSYQYNYSFANQEIIKKANDNITFFQLKGNSYDADLNRLFVKIYDGRFISDYYNGEDFAILFEYDFSTLLLFLMALIGSSRILWKERQDGTYDLLQVCPYSRKHIVFIKLSAFFVWIFLIGILLYAEDALVHSMLYHLVGWLNPIYSIESYRFCTFSGSILEYIILSGFLRVLAVFVISSCFVFVTMLFNGNIYPIFFNILLFSGCLVQSEQVTEMSILTFLNPVTVMKPRTYTQEFTIINLFNTPVSGTTIALLTQLIFLFIIILLITVCWHNKLELKIPQFIRRKNKNDQK